MGGKQSARATHFTNETTTPDSCEPDDVEPVSQISISSKMVERLVEDALAVGATAKAQSASSESVAAPRDKERILSEKLRDLDKSHTEKLGLTLQDVRATTRRIEMRTANVLKKDPVCQDCEEKVMECYQSCLYPSEAHQCWEVVNEFTHCVQETAARRLESRLLQEEREAQRLRGRLATARGRLPALRPRPHLQHDLPVH